MDGTLAGDDQSLPQALLVMVDGVGPPSEQAHPTAIATPADVIGRIALGRNLLGAPANLVNLRIDWALGGA
jgi:N-acetylglucosamine-6-phosphate deacetylase